MTVRLGSIDLERVQRIRTAEPRHVIELAVPGRAGGVLLNLGRPAVMLELEGVLLGEQALDALTKLRKAQRDASPLTFAADILSGLDLTDVLVEALQVEEVGGFTSRYRYYLALREHVDQPASAQAGAAGVNVGVQADAARWSAGAAGAAMATQDVSTLPNAKVANPAIVDHLTKNDMVGALQSKGPVLSGGGLKSIVDAVGGPEGPLGDVVGALKNIEMKDVVNAYKAIRDPKQLPALLGEAPAMLGKLGMGDLAQSVTAQLDTLGAGELGGIIGGLLQDPGKVVEFVKELSSAGSFGEFMSKLATGSAELLDELGVKLGPLGDVIGAIGGGAQFLQALGNIAREAQKLVTMVRRYDPIASVRSPGAAPSPVGGSDIISQAGSVIGSIQGLLSTETLSRILNLALELGGGDVIAAAVDALVESLKEANRLLGGVLAPLTHIGVLTGMLGLAVSLVRGLRRVVDATEDELMPLGKDIAKAVARIGPTVGMVQQAIDGGASVLAALPSKDAVEELQKALDDLVVSLLDMKGKVA